MCQWYMRIYSISIVSIQYNTFTGFSSAPSSAQTFNLANYIRIYANKITALYNSNWRCFRWFLCDTLYIDPSERKPTFLSHILKCSLHSRSARLTVMFIRDSLHNIYVIKVIPFAQQRNKYIRPYFRCDFPLSNGHFDLSLMLELYDSFAM